MAALLFLRKVAMTITPLMPVYPRCGFRPVRGEGAWLFSEDGSKALDFATAIRI
jgi:acetylornithine/N-succinyldiaminopimelate aminotransferase